jgi:hypothetical protein
VTISNTIERHTQTAYRYYRKQPAPTAVRERVIRQHLPEWLRFSLTLDSKEGTPLPVPNAEVVRQYVAERVAVAAPADSAFFGPPSGSFWRQMGKGVFAVAFAARLLPGRGSARF